MATRGIHLTADVLRERRWWQRLVEVAAYPAIGLGALVAGTRLFDLGLGRWLVVPGVIVAAGIEGMPYPESYVALSPARSSSSASTHRRGSLRAWPSG